MLLSKSAAELAEMIRVRRLGAKELTEFYLERIERYDGPGGLNAVSRICGDALAQAREIDKRKDRGGALLGLPLLIKENIDVAGMATTAGSLALEDNIALRDAPVVARLRRSGAVILGKTNMTELANYMSEEMPGGYSSLGGQVRHAYDRRKNPGGSSSGSAVAVSAGLCAGALGTDTSFSIVGCAANNGITGFKPAHGSVSGKGIVPIAHTLDTAGPMARSLEDAILLYSQMAKKPPGAVEALPPERLRLAVNLHRRETVGEERNSRMEKLLAALRDDGARVEEVIHSQFVMEDEVMRHEFRHDLEQYLRRCGAKRKTLREIVEYYESHPDAMPYGDAVLRDALDNSSGELTDTEYVLALDLRRKLRREIRRSLAEYDACLLTGRTSIMHFTGLPSVALRLGMDAQGAPMGIILYGKDEGSLLRAALTLERYADEIPLPPLEETC